MLDENLPTYHFQASSENPLHTLLYFTYQGSEPHAEYLLKRPSPAESHNQYAFGLFDVQYSHVLYAEILLRPEWSQPTLSAAELRAQHGANAQQPPATALTPYGFTIDLYNPDQSVAIKQEKGSWGRSDAWEFEVPERSFRTPSASKVDQESGQDTVPELTPKVMFRWKRDSRLSKDMTCYMSGRSIGGKKNKEPDITVALFRQARHESNVTIYEPNMARVDVEDRKGLEVILLLTAEIIRDLYLMPRSDPFNTVGAPPPTAQQLAHGRRGSSPLHATSNGGTSGAAPAVMSGANHPSSSTNTNKPLPSAQPSDAEARRLQEVFAREEREARERRDREEQQRIKRMLQEEEAREKQRRQAEVDAETERLRREYGVAPDGSGRERSGSTPSLPPRPGGGGLSPPPPAASGANGGGGWFSGPVRPTSAGPSGASQGVHFAPPPTNGESGKHSKRPGPYQLGSSAAATMSGFFGRSDNGEKKKVKKKRSVHF